MSQWSWTYMLIPLADLDNGFPAEVTQYDFDVTDNDENVSTVHPTFSTQSRRFGLGAESDTHRVFKISCLSLETGGDFDQFRDLGYEMLNQAQAAAWVAALPDPEGD